MKAYNSFMTKQEKSWIMYDVGNSAFVLIVTTSIMPLFFKDIASQGFSNAASTANLGFTNAIASMLLVITAPFLGTLADYPNMKKKLLSFFMFTGVIFTFLLSFIGAGSWLTCSILFIMASIGFAGANIFYDSLLIDITDKKKMNWISSSGYGWGYIGSVIPFLIVIIYIFASKGPDSSEGLTLAQARLAFIITSAWWLVFSIPLLKNVKQVNYIKPEKAMIRKSFLRLFQTFKKIKKHKQVFLFLIAYFFYIDGIYTIIKMAMAYGRDIGIQGSMLVLIILMIQVVAFPFALIYGKLADKYSVKKMLYIGICIYIIITLTSYFLPILPTLKLKIIIFWCISFFVATSLGGMQALSRSFFGQLIPKKKFAEFFGFYNMFGKFAAVLGPLLMALITKLSGHSRYGILSILLLFIVGGFFLTKVKEATGS